MRDEFFAGRLDSARQQIDELKSKRRHRGEADVFELDLAMIELANGRPDAAERHLRAVRDRFDHLEQKSAADLAKSMLTDDAAAAYSGEDYERVLIRAMLAISNLMRDGGDAGAYALQVTDKQQEIIRKLSERDDETREAAASYKQVALGPYVRAMLAEESPLTLDEAARARAQVVNFEPDFAPGKVDLARATDGPGMAPGHGAVYLFAFVGRGPVKEEVAEAPTQVALLIADRVASGITGRPIPPTLAPVKIPKVMVSRSAVRAVDVFSRGASLGRTVTLVDVGEMARSQQEARYPEILARAVVRRVLKKGAIYAAQDALDANAAASVGLMVAGVAWEATEKADTRCWGLLPGQIQVLRFELPAGDHELTLAPTDSVRLLGPGGQVSVSVRDGRNTYMLANFPDSRLVGRILTSDGNDDPSLDR